MGQIALKNLCYLAMNLTFLWCGTGARKRDVIWMVDCLEPIKILANIASTRHEHALCSKYLIAALR